MISVQIDARGASFLLLSMVVRLSLSVNKTKVLHGIPRDPDVAAVLAELEMEEEGNTEPKVCETW